MKSIVAELEKEDLEDISQAFCVSEIIPRDADDECGVEKSPLFQKLKCHCSPSKRVKLFWESLEKALLQVYALKKPYDTAVYCANTEPRDLTTVVFQHVLCDALDCEGIVQALEGAAVSSDVRVVIPSVLTLEDEIEAIKSVLCPRPDDSHHWIECRGLKIKTISTVSIWEKIEEHLRYGILDIRINNVIDEFGKKLPRLDDLNLVNCAFTTPSSLEAYPRVESLVDVRTYVGRLVLETERFMTKRSPGCRMENIGGITYILRRLLLRSVCIVPQDRSFMTDGTYLCLTTFDVEGVVTKLMESTSRVDVRAVSRMQSAMKTITGQEIRSHRFFDSKKCVVGVCTANTTGYAAHGLRNVGGGHKELLLVLTALHGVGADTVILDSPGFSLHPPQQKALALWISKCLYQNAQSRHPLSPVSVCLITNSTEFITEDSLPCLYCFRRTMQSCVKTYRYKAENTSSDGASVGVKIYDRPHATATVIYVIPPSTEIRCRGRKGQFSELVDGSGYILLNDVEMATEDSPDSEVVIR